MASGGHTAKSESCSTSRLPRCRTTSNGRWSNSALPWRYIRMIDLDTQLRDYIDGIAAPVPSPAGEHLPDLTVVDRPRRRHRAVVALVAAVATAAAATVIVLAVDRGSES